MLNRVLFLAAVVIAAPASAFTVISDPHAAYVTETSLLGVPASPLQVTSVADPELTVSFSTALLPLTVGAGWSTWGSPPNTENNQPRVMWTQGATLLSFTFSNAVSAWGFEAQPEPFAVFDITADFYRGGTLVGSITRSVDGTAGARLFAAAVSNGFTRVDVYSDADFAVAQLRYTLGVIPEPATWGLMIAGFGMVGVAARRRRAVGTA